MESAAHVKSSESGLGSRPGLRSSALQPHSVASSMGQNALATFANGSTQDTPSSTTNAAGVLCGRASPSSDRLSSQLPIVNVRGSCSSVNKDPGISYGSLPSAADTKFQSSSSEICKESSRSSLCPRCGASLDGICDKKIFMDLWQKQLQLFDQQRATLLEREAELQEVRQMKNQLQIRLERMERRLAYLPANDSGDASRGAASSTSLPPSDANNSRKPVTRNQVSVSGKRLASSFGSEPPSRSPSPSRQQSGKPKRRYRTPRPAHLVTNMLYDVATRKHVTSALCRDAEPAGDQGKHVAVPSWRIVEDDSKMTTLRRSSGGKEVENLSDEAFLQRHMKYEQEEKRIKRWDLQRVRKEREHQKLLKRYEEKEVKWHNQNTEGTREVITSFMPSVDNLEVIELTDDLPVIAFGQPVPNLPRAEFKLPWFSPAKRSAEGEPRKTRSKSRA